MLNVAISVSNLDIIKRTVKIELAVAIAWVLICHQSACEEVEQGDHQHYKCGNCKDAGKKETGHSTHWHKCPTYLEQQRKAKKTIPYYDQKNF